MNLICRMVKSAKYIEGQGKTGNVWRKQNFIVESTEPYNTLICVSAWGDNIEKFKEIKQGTLININFTLSSREYNDNWYSEITAMSVEIEGVPEHPEQNTNHEVNKTKQKENEYDESVDNLPF